MALPVLTWQQTAWIPVASTSAADYLDAVTLAITDSTVWELDETSAHYRTFKPAAGSAIPDVRMMVYYSNAAGVPHANQMAPRSTSPTNDLAYVGFSVDAGSADWGSGVGKVVNDPTSSSLVYGAARWSGFDAFDRPATRSTDQLYGVVSEEIVALVVSKSSVDTSLGAFIAGAIGVAHPDDADDADGRLWGLWGSATSGGSDIYSAFGASGGASTGVLTSYTWGAGCAYAQLHVADPTGAATNPYAYGLQTIYQPAATSLITSSGRTVVQSLTFSWGGTTPGRYGGTFRQMGYGPPAVIRTIKQDAGLNDKAICLTASLTVSSYAYTALYFTADAI